MRLAIADDDVENLDLMRSILSTSSFDIVTATSGADLVVLLTRGEPLDLIVTDIDMPWAEGFSVIQAARASQVDTPVLFVTGVVRPDLAETVLRLGNARLLHKPVSAAELHRTVKEMLINAS